MATYVAGRGLPLPFTAKMAGINQLEIDKAKWAVSSKSELVTFEIVLFELMRYYYPDIPCTLLDHGNSVDRESPGDPNSLVDGTKTKKDKAQPSRIWRQYIPSQRSSEPENQRAYPMFHNGLVLWRKPGRPATSEEEKPKTQKKSRKSRRPRKARQARSPSVEIVSSTFQQDKDSENAASKKEDDDLEKVVIEIEDEDDEKADDDEENESWNKRQNMDAKESPINNYHSINALIKEFLGNLGKGNTPDGWEGKGDTQEGKKDLRLNYLRLRQLLMARIMERHGEGGEGLTTAIETLIKVVEDLLAEWTPVSLHQVKRKLLVVWYYNGRGGGLSDASFDCFN